MMYTEQVDLDTPMMTEKESKWFITKVYSCLNFQLLLTFTGCMFNKAYELTNQLSEDVRNGLAGISLTTTFVNFGIILCCNQVYRKFPINYLLLLLHSLSMSYMVSLITSLYSLKTLVLAIGFTTLDTMTMTVLSFVIKLSDYFTMFLTICIFTLCIATLVNMFIVSTLYQMFIACVGSITFSGFLIYDTKLIISNKYRIYSKEDFIYASINLYLDIVNIFLYTLQCIGLVDN